MKLLLTTLLMSVLSLTYAQNQNTDFHLDKEYAVKPEGLIDLSSSDAHVTITGSFRKTAHVKIDREVHNKGWVFGEESFTVNVNEAEGNLKIEERSSSTHVGIVGAHYEKYTIVLEVPAGVGLRVRGDDGDHIIRSVNGAIDIKVDDGDIELIACKGSDFRFQIDDGDIKMDEGKGTLEVDADDADITIQKGNFSKINADMDDGDFIIQTSLTNNGEYFIDAQDGMVSFTVLSGGGKFDIRHDDARVQTEGNFNLVEKSEDRTRLTLANGNARVDIRADDARVKLIN
jgi:hypothetical protein